MSELEDLKEFRDALLEFHEGRAEAIKLCRESLIEYVGSTKGKIRSDKDAAKIAMIIKTLERTAPAEESPEIIENLKP